MEPQRVGPYRLERKLGAGGMGVVYAAWDERLERRVALKQIRPEGADDPRRRERLRREARAVAKLDHPAIVRIHDLLETPEGDWLVLQYVEGVTLAERLRQGPLAPEQVIALAWDALGALEAAHAQGLLHRDLKAENVILTESGRGVHAMVLDFGLAKLYAPDTTANALSLSRTGGLVGTYRSMSPEQANGLPLDPRSDLFSLGVLLYEAATGVSPFQGNTPVETLAKICTHLQTPVRELSPNVPAPLSAWIDTLLEKDLERRPPSAGKALVRLGEGNAAVPPQSWTDLPSTDTALMDETETARTVSFTPYRGHRHPRHLPLILVLVLVGTLGLFLAWRLRSPREPLYVAVARPEVGLGADREEVAIAASALQAAALRGLSSLEGIAALASGRPEAGEPDPSPQKLARLQAADEVLASSLDCQPHQCIAVLRRVRGSDGSLLNVQTFEVPLDDLRLLDTAVDTYLKRGYEGFQTRPEASRLQVRAEDYERFLRVQRLWDETRPSDLEPLFAELDQIRETSPLFVDAYLLEARLLGRRFFETRDAGDLDRSLNLIDQARRLAPSDPLPLITLIGATLPAGRLDEAEEALGELEQKLPGDVLTLHRRALLSEQRGNRQKALKLLRAAVERHPSVSFSLDLANMEMRLGEFPAARRNLEDLLRRFPEHPAGETLLAQLELEFGSPARAAELYAHLVGRRPGFAEYSNLGIAQLLLGRYGDSAMSHRRAAALAPKSATAALNLADAEALRGRVAEARTQYRRVLELIEQDPAPGFWQTLSIKAQAQAHLGRTAEAAASIQQAVVAAPDNPQIAFEASLVYAVIGDTASALASAKRALDSGFDRRWFSLPWFDPLWKDPDFRNLINRR